VRQEEIQGKKKRRTTESKKLAWLKSNGHGERGWRRIVRVVVLVGRLGLCHDRSPAPHPSHMRAPDQIDKLILSDFPYVLSYVRFAQLG
jgi:hypothetical protein